MMQRYQYRLDELEGMIPWEREIYVALLSKHIQAENERIRKEQAAIKSRSK
jgi:hypothetical protein